MRSTFTAVSFLIFLCAFITAAVTPSLAAAEGDIFWLCPSDPVSRKIPATHYMGLFDERARWVKARSHIQVFKIYPDIAARAPADDLRRIFRYLDRHHIALALEWGVLTATSECGGGVEGYSGPLRAWSWRRQLGAGVVSTIHDIAAAGEVSDRFVNRKMRLA